MILCTYICIYIISVCVCSLVSRRFLQVPALAHLLIAAMQFQAFRANGKMPWKICCSTADSQGMFDHLKGRLKERLLTRMYGVKSHIFEGGRGERPMSLVVSFSSLPVPSLYVVDGTDVHITQQCDGRAASIVLTEQRQQVLLPPVRLSQTESDNLFEYVWVRAARFA